MIRALVVDCDAVPMLQATTEAGEKWFATFDVHDELGRIYTLHANDIAVIASERSAPSARILVVNLGSDNFFTRYPGAQMKEIFRRILIAAQSSFGTTVNVPYSWRPYNSGSKISFNALPFSVGRDTGHRTDRIEIERNPFGHPDVYVFNCSDGWNDIAVSAPERGIYERAREVFDRLIESGARPEVNPASTSGDSISLSDESFFYSENDVGFEDWIDSRLTSQQKEFVRAVEGHPVRLRGAAGTGKTLALAIKVLADMQRAVDEKTPKRIVFLTHSSATCAATSALIESLDRSGIRKRFYQMRGSAFAVQTMLDLAMEVIGDDLNRNGILPLATDALEGRRLQLELIESIVVEYRKSGDWQLMRGLCSNQFREMVDASSDEGALRRLCWEFMNEFACVLDADGVQQRPELRKRYLSSGRMAWMMPLEQEGDRKVVLALYDRFNLLVSQMDAISVDQVIADYLNYLDSFRWNAIREKRGYDLIYIDELHLFNRQERMAFNGLTSKTATTPSLYMAYDPKQSPSDSFMPTEERESASAFWGRLGIGGIQKVELDRIFRYSPEITKFIASLDQSFPALDLGEDWEDFAVDSATSSARVPSVSVLRDEKELYSQIFERAHALKRRGGEKYSVAVLCCNPDNFSTYRDAGSKRDYFRAVSSRDEAAAARPDAFRFLLSTPDYVAGLQFDCVLLLDVNRAEVPSGPYSAGLRRRFISTVYLGASRAKQHLEIYATQASGGAAPILDGAVESGSLLPLQFGQLPHVKNVTKS